MVRNFDENISSVLMIMPRSKPCMGHWGIESISYNQVRNPLTYCKGIMHIQTIYYKDYHSLWVNICKEVTTITQLIILDSKLQFEMQRIHNGNLWWARVQKKPQIFT